MKLQSLYENQEAVSPVIGVILMVAVTVIIAAVIGSSALGIGQSVQETAPTTSFSAETEKITFDDGPVNGGSGTGNTHEWRSVVITHESGDSVDPDNIEVTVDGIPAYAVTRPDPLDFYSFTQSDYTDVIKPWDQATNKGENGITAGDTTTITHATTNYQEAGSAVGEDDIVYAYGDSSPHRLVGGNYPSNWAEGDGHQLQPGQTVRVIWTGDSDSSVTLYEYEIDG